MLLAGLAAIGLSSAALADDVVTLKIHHLLPPQATVPKNFIEPWTKKVEAESGGRIKFEIYPAMQLGGAPPALIDQVRDDFVDLIWTLPGYTPGRFPKTEVFELPFIATSAQATSRALERFYFDELQSEYENQGIHIITMHVHSPGLIHSKTPITKLEDMRGKKVRGPTRVINWMLEVARRHAGRHAGAGGAGSALQGRHRRDRHPVGGDDVAEDLGAGAQPHQLLRRPRFLRGDLHLRHEQGRSTIPCRADLKKVIDDNSGLVAADWVGKVMDDGDAPGLKMAQDLKNNFITLDAAETKRWEDAAQPIYAKWVEEMKGKGVDGQALIDKAKKLIAEESAK